MEKTEKFRMRRYSKKTATVLYPFSPLSSRKNGYDFPLLEFPPPPPPSEKWLWFSATRISLRKMGIPGVGKTCI